MTFVGFDLQKRYITACALDDAGGSIAEIRQLSTAVEAVRAWLSALPGPVTVGLEATLYWEWLATRRTESGHTVRVAHAFHVKLIWQARAKTDPIDARTLAELLRVHLFPAIWLPDLDTRERRPLLRGGPFSCASGRGSRIGFMAICRPRISRALFTALGCSARRPGSRATRATDRARHFHSRSAPITYSPSTKTAGDPNPRSSVGAVICKVSHSVHSIGKSLAFNALRSRSRRLHVEAPREK